jgi:hypothetical protein
MVVAMLAPACRSPKKVLTERDKQQVKDSILTEIPKGEELIPIGANFDDKIELVGYSVNKHRAKPGEALALVIYWKCLAQVTGDFKIFVHLDSSRARKTYDHYAVNGLHVTSNWQVGEVIKDEMALQVDQTFPEGPAKLWIGFFEAKVWKEEKKNVRMPVKSQGAARADKQDRLLLTAFMFGDIEDKKLAVKKTGGSITVDGKLDEAQWKQAFVDAGTFYSTEGKPIPEAEKVEAGLLFDDQNLYVAFNVKDADLQTPYKDRDSTLWSGGKKGSSDVVELYFDPDADGLKYLELQVSPAGVIFDALFDSYRSPEWKEAAKANLEITAKAVVDGSLGDSTADKGYVVELAIPWKQLPGMTGAPAAERKFGLNMFRLSNSGTWAAAWSPVGNDFHDLMLAGTAVFVP